MAELVVKFEALTDEQKKIVEDATNNHDWLFIEGPPGSGKTCISLQIVRSLIGREVVKPLVLIYNNSLLGYLKSSFEILGIKDNITILTKDKFFWDLRKEYNIPINFNDTYEHKHKQILEGLLSKKMDLEYSIILLDEIQDFTDLEWKFLSRLSRRFILLGDFEQRIYNSDLSKSTILSVTQPKVLTKIFRFGSAIAEWVQKFSKSNTNLVSKVNSTGGVKPISISCASPSVENEEIAKIIEGRKADGERLAVISINKNRLSEVHEFLTSKGISHYYTPDPKDFKDFDFSKNDPVLITSASAKGLEFYSVIVTGFDFDSPAVIGFMKHGGFEENIYVCLSRATKHLFVLQNPNTVNELKDLSSSATVEKDEESDWF